MNKIIGEYDEVKSSDSDRIAGLDWSNVEEGTRPIKFAYIWGYKNSADCLVDKSSKLTVDTVVFSICFLYRHYLELLFKNVYESFFNQPMDNTHSLKTVWESIKKRATVDYCLKTDNISTIESVIETFQSYDYNEESFRYPLEKGDLNRANANLNKNLFINIDVLKEEINKIDSALYKSYMIE